MIVSSYCMLEWLEAHELPCLFKNIFGVECPGCGFQRAMVLLLQGKLKESFFMWPALLPLWLFLFLYLSRIMGMKKISGSILKKYGFVCLIIILISYLLRLIINIY